MYECFHCGQKAVGWCADFDAEDYGYDDSNGLIHECYCSNCGAYITYYIPGESEDDDDLG